jgi:hypothetical protein
MFDDTGVEIILRDPQDRRECGRIAYHLQMFSGRRLSHPSGDWMIAWCGRHHLKFSSKAKGRGIFGSAWRTSHMSSVGRRSEVQLG